MKKLILTEEQIDNISKSLSGEKTNIPKQQLFNIAILSHKLWEQINNEEELDEWVTSKISHIEQDLISITKVIYGQEDEKIKGMDTLNYDDLIIGN